MSATTKLVLSCVGVFMGGMVANYQAQDAAKIVFDARFWVGLAFAGLAPLASYFFGLAQRAPWDTPTLPTTIVETKRVVTDPAPAPTTPPVVTETITKKPGG